VEPPADIEFINLFMNKIISEVGVVEPVVEIRRVNEYAEIWRGYTSIECGLTLILWYSDGVVETSVRVSASRSCSECYSAEIVVEKKQGRHVKARSKHIINRDRARKMYEVLYKIWEEAGKHEP